MNVMIFGANGYIGGELRKVFPDGPSPDVDIADREAVGSWLDSMPDVVINAAGKTGRPNVDWCETHKQATFHSNVRGARVLLGECLKRGLYYVHLGSGCIYMGNNDGRGWAETDAPFFTGSFYSYTKRLADLVMSRHDVLNIRLRMPLDGSHNPRNLLTKLSGYERLLTAQNSITYLPDFFAAIEILIDKRITGTFNVTNPGTVSPFDIGQIMGWNKPSISASDLDDIVLAQRSSCVLDSKKISRYYKLMPIRLALEACRKEFA